MNGLITSMRIALLDFKILMEKGDNWETVDPVAT